MTRSRKWLIGGGLALALAGTGAGAGIAATAGDDSEPAITGEALQRASEAAIAHVGGGVVTDTEVGDEEGFYEVEVTLDGRQIDVHLAEDFTVISSDMDRDGVDDDENDTD